jgi:predicted ATPase/DNA-binding SARP family transcriptional activator
MSDSHAQEERDPPGRAEEAERPLVLRLLGPWQARLHGQPVRPLRTRKGQWLLAQLLLQKGRAVQREWLAGLLWPESATAQSLFNLRRSLTDLRHALGGEADRLQSPTPRTLCFDLTDANIDLLDFDEAMACGDARSLERAVRLYRGPLLPECCEEWIIPERMVREQAYLTALETLATEARARADPGAAAAYLRQALAVDPLQESAQQALMEALVARGDEAAALQVYHDYRRLVRRQARTDPGAAITGLFEQLRARHGQGSVPAALVSDPSPLTPRLTPDPSPPAPPPFHLPHPISSFVGRRQEVLEITGRLATERLVTLTGPGGVGKTRLAIQAGVELREEYPDGVWFVDLAGLAEPALVTQAVAQVLGIREEMGRPLTDVLLDAVGPRRLLLILDNCEHLLDAAARLAEWLLEGCPALRLLATSRQSLGLTGEVVWRVPSLSLPAVVDGGWLIVDGPAKTAPALSGPSTPPASRVPDHPPSTLLESEAIRLFVERGLAADRAFALTEQNAPAVAEICRQLDGIPLAIELAAARLKLLGVQQIADRLADRFRLLTEGSRTAAPRQQTLRAAMDWSYDLLAEPERVLLRRLSVFAGGFALEAAEAVVSGQWSVASGQDSAVGDAGPSSTGLTTDHWPLTTDVLDLLARLVDKSLVQAEEAEGERRYRLLETVRQHARERLGAAAEAAGAPARHRDWFTALAERGEAELEGPEQEVWLQRLEAELDNFRAALEWGLKAVDGGWWLVESGAASAKANQPLPELTTIHHPPSTVLRLAGALWRFFYMRGYVTEGRLWLERALAASPAERSAARAKALHGAAVLCHEQGEHAAARGFEEESLALRRELGDPHAVAAALDQLGHIVNAQDDYERAQALFEESLALRREVGDRSGTAASLNALGYMALFYGDYARAEALCGESLALRRELGDRWGMAYSLEFLGQMALDQGDGERALGWIWECLELRRQLGDRRGTAAAVMNLARAYRERGHLEGARAQYEECLRLWQELGSRAGTASCLGQMAMLACDQGDCERATALFQESLRLRLETGPHLGMIWNLEGLAAVASAQGQPARAMRLLGAAEAARELLGSRVVAGMQALNERTAAAARAALGGAAFAAARAEGRALTLEEAVHLALENAPG